MLKSVRSALLHIFQRFSLYRSLLFWPGWTAITALAIVAPMWLFGGERRESESRNARFRWSGANVVALVLLAVFLGGYFTMMLAGEDFDWYDDSQLTGFSVRGVNFPPPISAAEGRFYPLSLQEFNVIRYVTTSPAGYQVFSILEIVALALLLLVLDWEISISARALLIVIALLTPTLVVSFTGLVYTERSIILLLACLALSLQKFERTHARLWAVAALVSAQVMLYLKEPPFLLLLGLVGARLILRGKPVRSWMCEKDSQLDLCIGALCGLFVAFYLVMIFPHTQAGYLVNQHKSLQETMRFYLDIDLLVWVFSGVSIVRLARIFRGRAKPDLLWDPLGFGGLVYFATFLALGMAHRYYLAPADFIAVLYLGNMVFGSWVKMGMAARVGAAALAGIVLCQSIPISTYRMIDRKYMIHWKAKVADALIEFYQHDPTRPLKIYFPFSDAWVLTEFIGYLNYRGLPMQNTREGSLAGSVEVYSPKIEAEGRCTWYSTYVCHLGTAADSGDLVVILPDDWILPAQRNAYVSSAAAKALFDQKMQFPRLVVRVWNHIRGRWWFWVVDNWPPGYVGIRN
jgi:hypothetical protein